MTRNLDQSGITFIGFLMLCALVGIFALIGMKLFPLYMEKFKVIDGMKSVAAQPSIASMTPKDIQKALLKNFEVQDVDQFNLKNIGEYLTVEKDAEGPNRIMSMEYESRSDVTDELDVVMKFSYSIEIPGTASQ